MFPADQLRLPAPPHSFPWLWPLGLSEPWHRAGSEKEAWEREGGADPRAGLLNPWRVSPENLVGILLPLPRKMDRHRTLHTHDGGIDPAEPIPEAQSTNPIFPSISTLPTSLLCVPHQGPEGLRALPGQTRMQSLGLGAKAEGFLEGAAHFQSEEAALGWRQACRLWSWPGSSPILPILWGSIPTSEERCEIILLGFSMEKSEAMVNVL